MCLERTSMNKRRKEQLTNRLQKVYLEKKRRAHSDD